MIKNNNLASWFPQMAYLWKIPSSPIPITQKPRIIWRVDDVDTQ
jgi:hypothetical protein